MLTQPIYSDGVEAQVDRASVEHGGVVKLTSLPSDPGRQGWTPDTVRRSHYLEMSTLVTGAPTPPRDTVSPRSANAQCGQQGLGRCVL